MSIVPVNEGKLERRYITDYAASKAYTYEMCLRANLTMLNDLLSPISSEIDVPNEELSKEDIERVKEDVKNHYTEYADDLDSLNLKSVYYERMCDTIDTCYDYIRHKQYLISNHSLISRILLYPRSRGWGQE